METISKRELDLKHMERLNCKTYESNLYRDKKLLYKIYKQYRFVARNNCLLRANEKKVRILHDYCDIDALIKAKRLVKSDKKLEGLEMDYIEDSCSLYYFWHVSKRFNKFLEIVCKASFTLENIHNDPIGIVVSDLNFENILFDRLGNVYFCDSDSYSVAGIPSTSIGRSLDEYYRRRNMSIEDGLISNDNLQMFLNFFMSVFNSYIDSISTYDYDMLSEYIVSLKNMRSYFLKLKNSRAIPELPYIHELIDPKDLNRPIIYHSSSVKNGKILVK